MYVLKFISQAAIICSVSTVVVACGSPETATPNKTAEQTPAALKAPTEAFQLSEADMAALDAMSTVERLEAAAYESHKLADVLAQVNDEASARAAAAEMHALSPMLNAVGNSLENLDTSMTPSTSIIKPMQAFAEGQARIFNESARIAKDHPDLQSIIVQGFEKIDGDF